MKNLRLLPVTVIILTGFIIACTSPAKQPNQPLLISVSWELKENNFDNKTINIFYNKFYKV